MANRCATFCSWKISSTRFCSPGATSKSLRGHAFNIGGGPQNVTSLTELLDLIAELDGAPVSIEWGEWRPGDQRYYVSDTTKFRSATGWQPRTGMEEGVRRLREWLRDSHVSHRSEALA